MRIQDELIHVLNLSEEPFKDYGGDSIIIKGLKVNDSINLHLDDYSKYNSDLSAVILSYTGNSDEYPGDYVSPPALMTDYIDRPYISNPQDPTNSINFNKVNLYYWNTNIIRLDSPLLHYKGTVQIFKKRTSLGYSSFERTVKFTR
ncbi:hypothetical protein [Xenorhabdus japonica]|uniref:Inclusion body protein n=1 Tax=Xenorhabdus japonica TaxID=53341 RepID=A0A1I5ED56_9GAMM|nr:hypothetical protein [Xenorhabdus japonica]SFO09320.1 Inclusion body protein [Xenorhabdus japonica]